MDLRAYLTPCVYCEGVTPLRYMAYIPTSGVLPNEHLRGQTLIAGNKNGNSIDGHLEVVVSVVCVVGFFLWGDSLDMGFGGKENL